MAAFSFLGLRFGERASLPDILVPKFPKMVVASPSN
jgi:hypothetical protein